METAPLGDLVGEPFSYAGPWDEVCQVSETPQIAVEILTSFPTSSVPEIAKLGRTLKRWSAAFLAYFGTGRANNGGTEAINGLIELHRRVARGFRNRDNYRLRMLLIGGGFNHPHLK